MGIVESRSSKDTVSTSPQVGQKWEAVRILDIILNMNHPKFKDYGGYDSIGTIYYTILKDNTPYETLWATKNKTAKPLFSHLKYYPLINEIVLILDTNDKNIYNSSNKSTYYLPQVNIWNHPHHNALPSVRGLESENSVRDYPETENGITRRVEDGSTDIPLGEYFKESSSIKPLLPYEGDLIIEGRFGNSIRFGSTNIGESIPPENKSQWSQTGNTGDPITIIRNGQSENTDEKGWVPIVEDSNNDASIIYMTSSQQITEFTPASLNQQSFGANIESQVPWDQELSDPLPSTTIEPEPETSTEENTDFGGGGPENEPITSTPHTPNPPITGSLTGSLTGSQEEEEDELTPFEKSVGDQEDLYYYEIILPPERLGDEEVEGSIGTYPLTGNLLVPLISQGDALWGHLRTSYPISGYTAYSCKAAGCCLTSCAMIISHIMSKIIKPPMLMGGPKTALGFATAAEAEASFLPRDTVNKIDTTPLGSGVVVEWGELMKYIKFHTGNEYKHPQYFRGGAETEEEVKDFLIAKLDAGIPVLWERKQDGLKKKTEKIQGYNTSTFIYGYNSPSEKPAVQRKFVYGNQHWMVITGYTSDGTYDPSFQVNDPNGASYRPDVSLYNVWNSLGRFMTFELKI